MSYCSNCGNKIDENSNFCSFCGTKIKKIDKKPEVIISNNSDSTEYFNEENNSKEIEPKKYFWIKFFAVLGCLVNPFFTYGLSLLWNIPLAVILFKKINNREKMSMGFKIAMFLFLNQIVGISLLSKREL